VVGASVRTIARNGDFNQGLIFYHFGSVEELLLAALQRVNETRIDRYRDRLLSVESLPELVQIAVDLHRDNSNDCDQAALSAIVAGWSSSSEVGKRISAILRPWDDLVETALKQSLSGTPLGSVAPTADLAHGISCLFLGAQLMDRLDPDDRRVESLLTSLLGMAKLFSPLLESLAVAGPSSAQVTAGKTAGEQPEA
jgi:AcrR family transcriptional regulator